MKKILAALLVLCMLVTCLAACAAKETTAAEPAEPAAAENTSETGFDTSIGNTAAEETADPENTEEAKEALPKYKIGFMYGHFTDKLGSQYKSSMEYIASGLNVEFTFIEAGYGEDAIAAIEAASASGELDGFIIATSVTPALLEAASGLPLVSVCNEPSAEDAQECAQYENYLGSIMDSDYDAAYAAAEALYAAGSRNVCLAGLTQGMSKNHDDRAQAFIDAVATHDDMTLLADDYSRGLFADSITSFAAAYPEMDGLFSTSGSDAVLSTMQTEGLVGKVKLVTIDISSESGTYFENGTLVWSCGGQYGTAMIGFAILYNYLADGTRIIEDTTVTMPRSYIYLYSFEDYEQYVGLVDGAVPVYVADELRELIHYYNEDVTAQTFAEVNSSYSLADIQARHADLIG